jgi:hypothetical protein
MAIVSVAIVLSFHLKAKPSNLGKHFATSVKKGTEQTTDVQIVEKRFALPLGIIFWLLSMACLVSGLSNYINTISRYCKRAALVQSGWKTQIVFTVVSSAIVATCVLFLSVNAEKA